jgi:hypothetical protein
VFIIETVQVEVPKGMFKGGNSFGCGFVDITRSKS